MKRITFIMTLLAGTLQLHAQSSVKGILQDSLTHEGEPYATVRIFSGREVKEQSVPVATALTNLDGLFTATISTRGSFVAVLSSTGKNTVMRPFNADGEKEIDLGVILTSDKESVMNAMEVVAAKPIVKMEPDKVSYSVADDVESRTLTVLDMLRKVPMVSVDGQDNISVNGQASFKVYVNGKPNMMLSQNTSQILKAMPATMVSSIEVITSPGAKYDAEGAGGILNLNMAQAAAQGSGETLNGYNGSLHADGGNLNQGMGGAVSGQRGKLSYSANLELAHVKNNGINMDMTRTQQDGTQTHYLLKTENHVPFVMGNIGLGYELTPLSQMNASFGIMGLKTTNKGFPTTSMSGGGMPAPFEYSNRMKNRFGQTQYNASLDFQHFLDKDRTGSISLIYQTSFGPTTKDTETDQFKTADGSTFPTSFASDRYSDGRENTQEHIVQADVVNKVASHSTLNYGVKYAFRRGTSDMDYYTMTDGNKVFDALGSTDYEHRNQIGAAYVESDNRWEKWTAKAGMRYEHTWQDIRYHDGNGKDFRKDYGSLVPSATVSHTLKPGQNIGATYNMRIARPGITYLNPYVDRSEPTSLTYGNEDLEVEKTHSVGLTYSLYTQKLVLSSSLMETIANGGIEQYSFYDDSHILNTTFGNIVDRRLTTLNVFAQWSMTRTTRVILNGSVTYSHLRSNVLDQKNEGWNAKGMLNVQQTLPGKWVAGLTLMCNGREHTLQGYNTGQKLGAITLSKSLLKERLTLSANGLVGFDKGGKLYITQYAEGKDFTSRTELSLPIARFTLSARWNFGNSSRKFKEHKANVQNDYIERENQTQSISTSKNM